MKNILELSRFRKKLIAQFVDFFLLCLALFLAVTLRYGELVTHLSLPTILGLTLLQATTILIGTKINMYSAVIRFLGQKSIFTIVGVVVIASILLTTYLFFFSIQLARSIPFIYALLAASFLVGIRLGFRTILQHADAARFGEPVIIYGAGSAGYQLSLALSHDPKYTPVAFVDDNAKLRGRQVHGIEVHAPSELQRLIEEFSVKRVLLAISNISPDKKKAVIEILEKYPVKVKTVPAYAEIISGEAITNLKDVAVEDLLGRDPIPPNEDLLSKCIDNLNVLVTGAGGSIGSELCKQIIKQKPRKLILLDVSEYSLYTIEKYLQPFAKKFDTDIVPLVGSVQDTSLINHILSQFDIDTIYHAAAYKHVPIVETNIVEGVKNNILGTYNLVDIAEKYRVKYFVLISTDKAVRPTNVMGATKRCAELILQAYAQQSKTTIFSMVRFGNVLGSSGSVVPLFKDQIKRGGPVTVTHPDIIRYFMTIPEAAMLVIQAGAMAEGGDVFVLDMGKPVKIVDLATKMIHLMGMHTKEENLEDGVEIKYTGLRPGEKLFEELLIGDDVIGTSHKRILRAKEKALDFNKLIELIEDLEVGVEQRDAKKLRELLINAPTEFVPSSNIIDHVWKKNNSSSKEAIH